MSPDDILWWSHGGELKGESWKRFRFLLDIMKQTPGFGLAPDPLAAWDEVRAISENEWRPGTVRSYYLIYYSFMRPSFREYHFDDVTEYRVRVIDTWNMTIEEQGIKKGSFRVELPGREYMAVQLIRV